MSRPIADLRAVDEAYAQLVDATRSLPDARAREPSVLPDWTRGHLLTHLARSADGDRRCVEGARRGEVLDKYPDGLDGRAGDIEAGAGRPAPALLADLDVAQRALVDAWRALPDDAWDRIGNTPSGARSMVEVVRARRREILVHLVDLDVGVTAGDLPYDYLTEDKAWIAEYRPDWNVERA